MNAPTGLHPHAEFVAALRAAAPYVHAHNGRVFVIAVSGEAASAPGFDRLIYDIALLHSLGVKLVLVHGARPQIDAQLKAAKITPKVVADHRVTDLPTLECVKSAVGALRLEIEARLSTSLANSPMGGARLRVASGNWITARPYGVRHGVDHQHTGEVRRVDAQSIAANLADGRIALLSPTGFSPTGEIFNLRAEDVATAVAAALSADKLVFLTPGDPRRWRMADDAGEDGQLRLSQARELLKSAAEPLDDLDRHYLQAAIAAADAGVRRVHIIDQNSDGAVLRELFTRDGAGLMIYADADYESTRSASIDDVGGILALIQPLEAAGILVPRSREQLELEIENFSVTVRDGLVVACCALFPFPESASGELACIAVHPDYRRAGRAEALLQRIEQDARRQGIQQLFTLTTHTPHWFVERGFSHAKVEDLPMGRRNLYNYQRNSLVLTKSL